ncbi:PAS domain S-box protein [Yeosuana sp. AK3]
MKQEETTEKLLLEIEALKHRALNAEKFQSFIIDSAIDAIITITEDGVISSWNRAAQGMFGYTSEEIINQSILHIISGKYLEFKDLNRLIKVWIQNKTGKTSELVAQRKDGTEFPVELSVSRWQSDDQNLLTGIIRDVTERKNAHIELQKLHSALKKSNEIVFMTDVEGVFTFVNDQFTNLYGFEPHEVLGIKTPRILKSPKNKRDFKAFWNTLFNKQGIPVTQYTNITKFGEIIDVEGSADPILDSQRNIIGFIGIQRDIRQRIVVLDSLKEALAKAQESDTLKSEFLANISHELRTPLNAIIGLSSLIDSETSIGEVLEYNDIIKSSGDHLLNIVENLIDISMIESKQLKSHKQPIKLKTILQELDELMRIKQKHFYKNHLEFHLIIPEEYQEQTLNTDKIKLIKIFKSLIENAFYFTNEGYINYGYTMYHSEGKPVIKFFVEDTGIGIHEENQTIIFDLFRQVDGSLSRTHEGIGTGLSIAKKLVTLLGGTIWVNSVVGQGSTFFFTIPFEETQETQKEPEPLKTKEVVLKDKLILIVEDDPSNFEYFKHFFERYDIQYIWAKNGEMAVNYCKEHPDIDLVLMDINLPILNGYEASKQIKKLYPDLLIVAQSAYVYDYDYDKNKLMEAGIKDYLIKPITVEILLEALKSYCT